MDSLGTEQIQHPHILWVDDDPMVLATAKRLFRNKPIQLSTLENPSEVISFLENNSCSVIIADQRMPQMTGIDLLENVKSKFPYITRIMLTGFLDNHIIEEAVNKASVFRFINKPWNDEELISDVNQALKHHEVLLIQGQLTGQVKAQNKQLTTLNEDLEKIVFERTKSISESKKEVEAKNNRIKNLISFIQELNKAESIDELLLFFKKEYHSKFNVVSPYLMFSVDGIKFNLLYFQKSSMIEKEIEGSFRSRSEIQYGLRGDQEFLAKIVGRPIANIISIPLLKFQSTEDFPPILYLEHNLTGDEFKIFLDYISERLQVIGLAVDRSLTYKKLRHISQQWENTFDSIEEPVAIIDIEYNILRMNRSFDMFSKILSDEEKKLLEESSRTGQPSRGLVKKNNKTYDVHSYPIKFSALNQATNFVNYYVDISEKRDLYGKMIQNEKMVALGLLAGNIAHELNNPLTGIKSLAQVLIADGSVGSKLKEDLQEISKAATRCHQIISDLLEFSDSDSVNHLKDAKVNINEIVNKTIPLLKTALRYHNLEIYLTEQPLYVKIKGSKLQQVVFNLINNACQAMKESGKVTVQTGVQGKNAFLSISDTGVGIDRAVIDKIFEPFFTTKLEGEGTGLGLSVCMSIVEKAGGTIDVKSEVGKGSEFKVILPTEQS